MKIVLSKLLALLLVFCLLSALPACSADPAGGQQDAAQTTLPPEPEPVIPAGLLAQYAVIRPATADSSVIAAASQLYAALSARCPDIPFKDDFYREGVADLAMGEYEILIGETNRPESAEYLSGLRLRDYGYALVGKKLVIAGATDEGTRLAIDAFCEKVLSRTEDEEIFYSAASDFRFTADYRLDELLIGASPVQAFRIVYPAADTKGESLTAAALSERIADAVGFALPIADDSTPLDGTSEIRVGNTNRGGMPEQPALSFDGTHLYLGGQNHAELSTAAEALFAAIDAAEERSLSFAPADALPAVTAESLTAMSYNIYCVDMNGKRINAVISMIERYLPDTFGVQEATANWMEILRKNLGGIYTFVGEGREGGTSGEHSAIAFKTDRFTLLEQDTFWLSDTPDRVSKYAGSACNRIATYARLRDLHTDRELLVVNTHLDHESSTAREKQAQVLADFVGQFPELPVILTGDFNAGPKSNTYSTVLGSGVENAASLSLYGKNSATHDSGSIIDFVFVNPAAVRVLGFKVDNGKISSIFPSDHFPVVVEYLVK